MKYLCYFPYRNLCIIRDSNCGRNKQNYYGFDQLKVSCIMSNRERIAEMIFKFMSTVMAAIIPECFD